MKKHFFEGEQIYQLARQIYPICRSITGDGVRKTLQILKEWLDGYAGLGIYEVPSGTRVFDWTVPQEWVIREAYIENEQGHRIIDFKENNLFVLGYSIPTDQWVELEELKQYIYTQPDQPDVVPYVTSYYKKRFGFCMSENQKQALKPGRYHMVIDSELKDGSLTYGEIILPGTGKDEILISTYICHPSMANNECSGPALSAGLVKYIASFLRGGVDLRYTYRFVYVPETIGSITYLSMDERWKYLKEHVAAGFNLSCVGDDRDYSLVESRYADTLADKALKNVLQFRGRHTVYTYLQRGSDERQYNAPGIDLPVVCFCRSKFGEYPEYHTSADHMGLVSPAGFQGSYDVMTEVIQAMEHNRYYRAGVLCEPQLGKRGLYPMLSQKGEAYDEAEVMLNVTAYADGTNDLIDISNLIGVPVQRLIPVVQKLENHQILLQNGGLIC